jgi:p-aminobenzoyl-glutamate transporter AbgT
MTTKSNVLISSQTMVKASWLPMLIIALAWIILFVIWFLLGIPLGPGYPISY